MSTWHARLARELGTRDARLRGEMGEDEGTTPVMVLDFTAPRLASNYSMR